MARDRRQAAAARTDRWRLPDRGRRAPEIRQVGPGEVHRQGEETGRQGEDRGGQELRQQPDLGFRRAHGDHRRQAGQDVGDQAQARGASVAPRPRRHAARRPAERARHRPCPAGRAPAQDRRDGQGDIQPALVHCGIDAQPPWPGPGQGHAGRIDLRGHELAGWPAGPSRAIARPARACADRARVPWRLARQPAPDHGIRFGAAVRPTCPAGRSARQCVRWRHGPRDRGAARAEGRRIPADLARRGRDRIAADEPCQRADRLCRTGGAQWAGHPRYRPCRRGHVPFHAPGAREGCHARCHACRAGVGRHRRCRHAGAAGLDAAAQAGQA